MRRCSRLLSAAILAWAAAMLAPPADAAAPAGMKKEALARVDGQAKLVQEMVDSLFSFGEPGFQEFETQAYVTDILAKNGFRIEKGPAGIPSAWTATWSHGHGGPKIALGSDVDALLGLSQKPGFVAVAPQVAGAPGHGEGHNSGMAVVVAAALAVKEIMEERGLDGTLMIWPGVAEELLGAKAFYVRAGMFADVDACIFTHVAGSFRTGYGEGRGTGMVSLEYTFKGKTAHAADAPWAGRSALDGVELMDVAWNMRREHLPLSQRSHYVITNGGGQPNVVPGEASVWYYFRDASFGGIRDLYQIGNTISEAAAAATGTTVSRRVLGYAAPQWGNRPLAEAAYRNIKAVGMPKWSAADQGFAKRLQETNGLVVRPLAAEVGELEKPLETPSMGGSSDDIGDVMWAVPTITIRYPSNVPSVNLHNVMAGMAMATPIAHKGAVAGAKAVALTTLDLLTTPRLVADAKAYQGDVQFAKGRYEPVLTQEDSPAIHLNDELMERMRPRMAPLYYDRSRYGSYLEQLGVDYGAFAK